ncbi:ABC transporter permease [Brachybacterium sp. DNPG3]
MTGLIASIVEAWGELRVNKGRVLLSLIGVAFSVFALTGVLGAGGMLKSSLEQSVERSSGRDTVLSISSRGYGEDAESDEVSAVVLEQLDAMGIDQRSRRYSLSGRIQTPQGVISSDVQAVDPSFATMFRIEPEQGRWLAASDARRLAPAVVINASLYESLGRPAVGTSTMTLYGDSGTEGATEALIIGVLPSDGADWPLAYVSAGALDELAFAGDVSRSTPEFLVWVDPWSADDISARLSQSLDDTPVGGFEVWEQSISLDDLGFNALTYAIVGVAVVVLLLGALGLVNISLVTVRYRVREIGIRRSYGATGLRIFVGVLMESVVATVVAGVVGVSAAVALMKSPFVTGWFREQGLVELPPFPLQAVLIGLAAATAVGILAGALPALIATRIKVIDAIRS